MSSCSVFSCKFLWAKTWKLIFKILTEIHFVSFHIRTDIFNHLWNFWVWLFDSVQAKCSTKNNEMSRVKNRLHCLYVKCISFSKVSTENWSSTFELATAEIVGTYLSGSQPFWARRTLIWKKKFGATPLCIKDQNSTVFRYFLGYFSFGGTRQEIPGHTCVSRHTGWEALTYFMALGW